jgi:hypothetical protein
MPVEPWAHWLVMFATLCGMARQTVLTPNAVRCVVVHHNDTLYITTSVL